MAALQATRAVSNGEMTSVPPETSADSSNRLDPNYEEVFSFDGDSLQLVRHLMKAFAFVSSSSTGAGADKKNDKQQLKRFFDACYPLVVSITHYRGFEGVRTVWLYSAHLVVQSWADRLTTTTNDQKSPLQLLRYVVSAWATFQKAVNLIHSLALYAEKACAEKALSEKGKPGGQEVRINYWCCRIFVECMLSGPLRGRITAAIIAVMKSEKEENEDEDDEEEEEKKSVATVQTVLSLLRYLDLEIDRKTHLYHRLFALPYLAALKRAHRPKPLLPSTEDEHCPSQTAILSYLRQAERIIEEENATGNKYALSEATTRMAARLLYSLLIESQRKVICAYAVFEQLMGSDQEKNSLGYLYQMTKFDEESVKLLTANIERHLSSRLGQLSLSPGGSTCTREQVILWVEQLQALYSEWLDGDSGLLGLCFAQCAEVHRAITSALAGHLNASPAHYCTLSLFVHLSLMAPSSTASSSLDRVLDLLALIEDKQALTEVAWHLLCHRIINRLSPAPEKDVAEVARLLERLQIETPISGKLILSNFYSSLSQLEKPCFQKRYGQQFRIHVLNGLWKLDNDPTTQTFRLPRSFWTMYSYFHRDFTAANRKKILKLNRNYGCSEMVAHFIGNSGTSRSYQFILSLRQTVVLLLFNRHDALSFEQIQAKSRLDAASLSQCLELFCKCELLLKTNAEEEEEEDFSLEKSTFVVNEQFSPQPLLLSISGCEEKHKDSTTTTAQPLVNWIKLQHELCARFDLGKLLAQCNGSDQPEESKAKPAEAEAEAPKNKEAQNESSPNSSKSVSKDAKASGSKTKSAEPATVVQPKPPSNSSKCASIADGRFRLEAAIIRVLKRATVVANLETLRDLTLEALLLTNWRQPIAETTNSSPNSCLSLTEMAKCVDSLEKNGYLRQLSSGDIVYEP